MPDILMQPIIQARGLQGCSSMRVSYIHLCANQLQYRTREIFGGGKYWRIRGNSPNFYPPNVLVLPSKQLAKVSSPIFYHPKVEEMCIRQYFNPPNISCVRYVKYTNTEGFCRESHIDMHVTNDYVRTQLYIASVDQDILRTKICFLQN